MAESGTPEPLLSLNAWAVVLFAMGAIGLAGAVAFLRLGLHTCGGDAGVGAPSLSPRGQFCDAGAPVMPFLGPLLAFAIGLGLAWWRHRRGFIWAALALGVVLVIAPVEIVNALSPHCSGPGLDCY
jgi:hypothetical protein